MSRFATILAIALAIAGDTNRLAGQESAKDDAASKLVRIQATAAQKAYQAHFGDMAVRKIGDLLVMVKGNTTARPDLVYTWSVRWLNAQLELSETKGQKIVAYQEHQKRMKQLHDQVKLMVGGGNSGLLPDSAVPESEWYLAEAELWLLKK